MADLGDTDTPTIPPVTEAQFYRSYNGTFDDVMGSGTVNPPVISGVTPSPGALGQFAPISLNVTDPENSLIRIILIAHYTASGIKEVVFDGAGFGPQYTNGYNTQTAIANGFTFQVLRNGGWPMLPNGSFDSVILTPFAIDSTGGENP